ncbi:MAG TPA: RNA polymerase factor sigma-32 [Stellaceae bacterium]|nr:RNA polymerase factor sigma-32 [Stellaceae bacterium]
MMREFTPGVRDRALDHYIAALGRFPMLEADEERELARRWRDNEDEAARDRLVTSHLRLVAKTARNYAGYGLAQSDLVSAGTVGLMRAVANFDPELGFRFATYAAWWIRAEIHHYVLDNWSLVRISRDAANRRLFFKLRRLKAEFNVIDEGDLDPAVLDRIAVALDVPQRAVAEMNLRLAGSELSLNVAHADSAEEWQDSLADDGPSPEAVLGERQEMAMRRKLLRQALEVLDKRERAIVTERRLSDAQVTLEALSAEMGISRERVRQLEARALAKLKASVADQSARPA